MRGDTAKTYLGLLCKRSHRHGGSEQSLRYLSTRACVECNYHNVKTWVSNHRPKVRQLALAQYYRDWEVCIARGKRYSSSPIGAAKRKQYLQEHREEYLARTREWRKTPKGRLNSRLNGARRRTRNPLEARHCVKTSDIQNRFADFNGFCAYCDNPANSLDHFIPVARGGQTRLDNLLPACRSCNCKKNDSDGVTWFKRQSGYNPYLLDRIFNILYGSTGRSDYKEGCEDDAIYRRQQILFYGSGNE